MYCEKCGNEVNKDAKFCTKCGTAVSKEKKNQEQEEVPAENKFGVLEKGVIGAVCIVLVAIIIMLYFSAKTPYLEEKKMIEILTAMNPATVEIEGREVEVTFERINNVKQEWRRDEELLAVECDADIDGYGFDGTLYCEMAFSKDLQGNWEVHNIEAEGLDIRPLFGMELLPTQEIYDAVESLYPEIKWDSVYYSGRPNSAVSGITFVGENTNLEEKTCRYIYDYWFYTHTADVNGTIVLDYVFDDSAQWVLQSAEKLKDTKTWCLNGMWTIDISDLYMELEIEELDWDEQTASFEAVIGSGQDGYRVYSSCPFYEENGCLHLGALYDIRESYGEVNPISIFLTAKIDDLYYRCPDLFGGEDAPEIPVGGRTE